MITEPCGDAKNSGNHNFLTYKEKKYLKNKEKNAIWFILLRKQRNQLTEKQNRI
jgi:hypothetical protein